MTVFRRLLVASAAAIVVMVSGVLVSHADSTPSSYNTPGDQMHNGRLWNTTCKKYFTGLCPLQVGTPMADLGRLGYAAGRTIESCAHWDPSTSLENRGVGMWSPSDFGSTLYLLEVDESGVLTEDGAHVGMTLGEVKALDGSRIRLETREGHQPVYTVVVKRDGYELVFLKGFRLVTRRLRRHQPDHGIEGRGSVAV